MNMPILTQTIQVADKQTSLIQYKSVPVMTTEQMAEFYGTDQVRIRQNYDRNNKRFSEGKHFFKIEGDDLRELKNSLSSLKILSPNTRSLTLWTEKGAAQERATYFEATKAEIGSRREATAMGRLSAKVKEVESLKVQLDKSLDFASIKAVEIATGRKFGWHQLKKWSKANSSEIKTIPDPNFGEVKTYHKDAWLAVYNINLSSIRGA